LLRYNLNGEVEKNENLIDEVFLNKSLYLNKKFNPTQRAPNIKKLNYRAYEVNSNQIIFHN
jgi:hypothetical protein